MAASVRLTSPLRLWLRLAAVTVMCVLFSGCSYVVLLGYLIGGPPSIEPAFDAETKESMTDKGVTVAVVCYAPTEVKWDFEDIDYELAKYVTYQLNAHKIQVINPDRVKAWLDQNPDWDKPEEIGEAFHVTYVIYIDLNEYSLFEENSANLYRGRAEAIVSVWKMDEDGTGEKMFSKEILSKYPIHQPISTSEETYWKFKGRYLSRLSEEVGHLFFEHYAGDEFVHGG